MKNVNALALLVVLVCGALVWHGDVEAESFLLLVTGLAIPARSDGYQSIGTSDPKPLPVEGVRGGVPVAVEPEAAGLEPDAPPASRAARVRRAPDAGHFDAPAVIVGTCVVALGVVLGTLLLRLV